MDELREKDFKSELMKREAEARRRKNGEIEIIEEKQITYGKGQSIYNDDVDIIGSYEPDMKKKIKRPDEAGEELVDLANNPFPEDADSESFVKSDDEQQEKKPRVHSESEDDDDDDEELLREYERIKEQREKEELHKVNKP
jgi:protein CWC15